MLTMKKWKKNIYSFYRSVKGFYKCFRIFFRSRWEILMPSQAGLSQPDSQVEEKKREERKVLLRREVEREREKERKEYTV